MFHSFELAGVVVSLVSLKSDFLVESSYKYNVMFARKRKKEKVLFIFEMVIATNI